MLQEAFEYIVALGNKRKVEIDERPYSTGQLMSRPQQYLPVSVM